MFVELIRHGMTAWSEEGRYQGISDLPLSPRGKAMLTRAGASPAHVYVSKLSRTAQTAAVLFPEAELRTVPGLEEMNFGTFEGHTWQEMENDTAYRGWVRGGCLGRCPGGEDRKEYEERVCLSFLELLEKEGKTGAERMVIVAHGGTQMALLGRFGSPKKEYWRWQRPCGCGYLLEVQENGPKTVLRVIKETSYTLQPEEMLSGRNR